MLSSGQVNYFISILPEEIRLVYQAKSGNIKAFVKLYDAYVERVYRYIYFLVPNDGVVEGLTFQVFFKVWKQFDRYQIFGSSFIVWLYSIAQEKVIEYYRTHKNAVASDNDFRSAVRGNDFSEEVQVIRDVLQFLTDDQQQVLILKFIVGLSNKNIAHIIAKPADDIRGLQLHGLQALVESLKDTELKINLKSFQPILEKCLTRLSNGTSTLDECLAHYPEHIDQLNPLLETVLLLNLGREVKPLSAFNAFTHDALIEYVQTHPRRQQIIMPILQRAALTFTMLAAAFLLASTARAQSALPGEPLYSLKLTSEQAWRTISPDPVGTDLVLAERRLDEWVAVSHDPKRNTNAMNRYLESISEIQSVNNAETVSRIIPALQSQQQTLSHAGLPVPQLNSHLATEVRSAPAMVFTQVLPTPTPTRVPPTATNVPPTATAAPPTATNIPSTTTAAPPTATNIPPTTTAAPPTATNVPPTETEVSPTTTDVSPTETEVLPTATVVPPPTATVVPPPTATVVPPPTATDVPPPTDTDVPLPTVSSP